MEREQIIEWAREAAKNHPDYKADEELAALPDAMVIFLEAFAKKVRDDYSNKHAQLWLKRIDEAVRAEREAIERVVGVAMLGADRELFKQVLGVIRARGN